MLGLVVLVVLAPGAAWTVDTTTSAVTVSAEADALVEQAFPDTNFGPTTTLGADTSPLTESYLRFTLTGLTRVASAKLRLYVTSGTSNGPALYLAENGWSETEVTWNTKPANTSGVIANAGSQAAGAWFEFDVTGVVTGNGTYTFHLVPESSDGATYNAREATANTPQLVVETLETMIDVGPSGTVGSADATFAFSSPDASAEFECSLDAAAFAACTSPQSYTGLGDGSHTFQVRAKDVDGNVDASPASRTWTVDTLAPAAPLITSPADGAIFTSSTVVVMGMAQANATVMLFDGGLMQATTTADGAGTWEKTLGVADGAHSYTARATDAAGNTSAASAAVAFTVDATGPETAIISGPCCGVVNSTTATFTFSASNPGAAFECRLDGDAFAPCSSPQTYAGLADGPHIFEVRAKDEDGKVDHSPAWRTWTVDATPPTAPTGLKASVLGTTEVLLAWTGSTDNLGETVYSLFRDDTVVEGGPATSYRDTTAARGTTYTYRVQARDRAGNLSSFSAPVTVTTPHASLTFAPAADAHVEEMRPAANFGSAPFLDIDIDSILGTRRQAYVRFAVTEVTGPVSLAKLRLYVPFEGTTNGPTVYLAGSEWLEEQVTWESRPARTSGIIDNAGSIAPGGWAEFDVTSAIKGDGTYTFVLEPESFTLSFASRETTKYPHPELIVGYRPTAIDSGPTGLVNSTTATFTFSASDPAATFECSLDGGPFEGCASPTTYTGLGDGEHTFSVRAAEATGNTDSTSVSRTWTIDTVPPSAPTGLAATVANEWSTYIDLGWELASDDNGIAAYDIDRGGAQFSTAEQSAGSARFYVILEGAPATYTFKVRARDTAGNWSPFSTPITVKVPFAALPDADASVVQDFPARNYGKSWAVGADLSPYREAYLRFRVTGLPGPVESAKLRLRAYEGTKDGPAVYLADSGWTEGGITWESRPARTSGVIADAGPIADKSFLEYDVTSAVTGEGTYTFNLVPESGDDLFFWSREADCGEQDMFFNKGGCFWPKLIITTEDDTTPPKLSVTPGRADTPDSRSGWFNRASSGEDGVSVDVGASDPSGVAGLTCTDGETTAWNGAQSSASFSLEDGVHTISCSATDGHGNSGAGPGSTPMPMLLQIDQTAPTLTCPSALPSFLLGGAGGEVEAEVTDTTSGPAQAAVSAPADVSSAGRHSVSLTGWDLAGNEATGSCDYLVGYRFLGFFAPLHRAAYEAGATIPLRFALANASGIRIPDGAAASLAASCAVRISFVGGAHRCAGYDAANDTFRLNLKTSRTLAPGSYAISARVYVGADLVTMRDADVRIRR